MKRFSLIVFGILGLLALMMIRIRYVETFTDGLQQNSDTIKLLMKAKDAKLPEGLDPATIVKNLRGLIDKYENKELWDHAKRVHSMKPEELARMHLTEI
jgi:hypothetical protein